MRLALLALLLAAPLAAQQPAHHAAPAGAALLPVDTAVHTGRLANGLRYLVRHNSYPEHRLELRLIVRAGSILEDSSQRGLAHFIEHMGFNGTTHFDKNDLVKYLQSIGVRYGADLNANTSFDETTYILPVPSDQPALVDRAFDILHDWASGDRFDSLQVVGERGVIMGEWRNGLGASQRELNQEIPVLLKGSRYAQRLPIGDTGIIMHAVPAPLRRFYHDWYRPDLMGVIAVGDYPVDSLVALIRSRFGALRNPAPERPRTEAPIPVIPGTRVAVITDSEETDESVEMMIRRPTVHHRTQADERRDLVNALANNIVDQRLEELERKPDAPFVSADFGSGGFLRDLQVYQVDVNAKNGQSAAAFAAVVREVRRFQQHGVLPAELERAKASLLRAEQDAAEETGKTESAEFVGTYTNAFLYGNAVMSARQQYQLAQQVVPGISTAQVDSVFRDGVRGTDRFIAVVGPAKARATLPTREALLAILARADTLTTQPWTETVVNTALVPDPPTPGRIVADTTYADLGVTDWHLSNGVRVLIKPTDFKADQIVIAGEAAGGLSLVPDAELLDGQLASAVMQVSGAGAFDAPELRKRLAGKIVFVSPEIDETSEGVAINTAPADLATALQVFWLTVTQPRLDTTAVAAFVNQVHTQLANRGNSPEAALSDTITLTLGRNSPRARPLTVAALDSFAPAVAMARYRDWFNTFGDFTFIIVGNVQLDSLRPLVAQWLGGLPAHGAARTWRDVEPTPPDSDITKRVYKGKEPVATQVVAFSGPATADGPATDVAAGAAAEILQDRLLDTLREAMGATYGVTVEANVDRVPRLRYRSEIEFKSSPSQADTLWDAAQRIIAGLQATGPTAGELQKYRAQAHRETEVAVKTNDWWLSELSTYVDPDGGYSGRPLDEMLQWSAQIDNVTPDQVRDAVRRYFDAQRVARFVLLPSP